MSIPTTEPVKYLVTLDMNRKPLTPPRFIWLDWYVAVEYERQNVVLGLNRDGSVFKVKQLGFDVKPEDNKLATDITGVPTLTRLPEAVEKDSMDYTLAAFGVERIGEAREVGIGGRPMSDYVMSRKPTGEKTYTVKIAGVEVEGPVEFFATLFGLQGTN